MRDTQRIGIVGAGAIGDLHAMAIDDIENAELVAASRRSADPGREFGAEHDCEWYADYETLMDEAEPDAVTVATPSGAHLEPTIAAAKRDIDVLCEKPLEITTERVDQMVAAADDNKVKLGGIFQQRFNDVLRTARNAIDEGRLGSLSVADASVPWWRDEEYYKDTWKGTWELDGGGAVMNQSVHAVDALGWLAAADMDLSRDENPVAEVFAYTNTRGHDETNVEVEDTAVASLRYRNGAVGQLLATTATYPGTTRTIRAGGRDGTIMVAEDELRTWAFREEYPEDNAVRKEFSANGGSGGASDPMAIDYSGHTKNIEAFLDWDGADDSYELDGQEARKAVAVVEAVYKSAEKNRPISLTSNTE